MISLALGLGLMVPGSLAVLESQPAFEALDLSGRARAREVFAGLLSDGPVPLPDEVSPPPGRRLQRRIHRLRRRRRRRPRSRRNRAPKISASQAPRSLPKATPPPIRTEPKVDIASLIPIPSATFEVAPAPKSSVPPPTPRSHSAFMQCLEGCIRLAPERDRRTRLEELKWKYGIGQGKSPAARPRSPKFSEREGMSEALDRLATWDGRPMRDRVEAAETADRTKAVKHLPGIDPRTQPDSNELPPQIAVADGGLMVLPRGRGTWEKIATGDAPAVPWHSWVKTGPNDRSRVVLPEQRGMVHVQPGSLVRLSPRRVRVAEGEVFVQTPPSEAEPIEIVTARGTLQVYPDAEVKVRPTGFARLRGRVERVH